MKEIRKKFYFGSNRRDAIFYAFHKLFPAAFHCYEYMHVFIVLVNYEIYEYPWSTDEWKFIPRIFLSCNCEWRRKRKRAAKILLKERENKNKKEKNIFFKVEESKKSCLQT